MINNIYAMYDVKLETYLEPFIAKNDDVARRKFVDIMRDVPQIQHNASDFNLKCIGTWCNETGKATDDGVHFVVNGLSLLKAYQREIEKYENTQVSDETPIQSSSEGSDST
ncbi:nonstructural protein [Microviridae sp.]|nr:nonstructural protein [Microviridae sp.]